PPGGWGGWKRGVGASRTPVQAEGEPRVNRVGALLLFPLIGFGGGVGSLASREHPPQRRDQPLEFDRLGVELVAARAKRLLALPGERMRGERDDRDVARVCGSSFSRRVASQPSTTGISRSIRMMSRRSAYAIAQPFSPSSAARTSKSPSSSSRILSI